MVVLDSHGKYKNTGQKPTNRTINLATYRPYRRQPNTCSQRSFYLHTFCLQTLFIFRAPSLALSRFCSSHSVVHPRAWTRTPDVHINFGAPISSFIYFNTAPVWGDLLCERRDSPETQKTYRLRMGPEFSLSAQFMSFGSKNQIRLRHRRLSIRELILYVGLIEK